MKMEKPGTWGDWITVMGLVNMLNVEVAVVSSLGQDGLRIISPTSQLAGSGEEGNTTNGGKHLDSVILLGHEAEKHYHSLEPHIYEPPDTPAMQG
jgi:hypothetical protein